MPQIFSKVHNGALDAARVFAKLDILRKLGLFQAGRNPLGGWEGDAPAVGLLHNQGRPIDEATQIHLNIDLEAYRTQKRQPSGTTMEVPLQSAKGPVNIATAKNQNGEDCLALLITTRLLQILNDIAFSEEKCKVKELTLSKTRAKMDVLRRRLEDVESLQGRPDAANDLRARIERLDDKRDLLELHLNATQRSISTNRIRLQDIFEDALETTNLLRRPEVADSIVLSESEADHEEPSGELHIGAAEASYQTPAISEEEYAIRDAHDNLLQARENLAQVQLEFDRKEWRCRAELQAYEAAVDDGTAPESRSEHDRWALACCMHLTRELIDAEEAYKAAKQLAQGLGAIAEGWGESSLCTDLTDITVNPEEVDMNDLAPPMSIAGRARIDSWLAYVDGSPQPHSILDRVVEIDDWDCRAVEISDSCSLVDDGRYGEQIRRWQMACDERRRQWRKPSAEPDDSWVLGVRVLGRRMSL